MGHDTKLQKNCKQPCETIRRYLQTRTALLRREASTHPFSIARTHREALPASRRLCPSLFSFSAFRRIGFWFHFRTMALSQAQRPFNQELGLQPHQNNHNKDPLPAHTMFGRPMPSQCHARAQRTRQHLEPWICRALWEATATWELTLAAVPLGIQTGGK